MVWCNRIFHGELRQQLLWLPSTTILPNYQNPPQPLNIKVLGILEKDISNVNTTKRDNLKRTTIVRIIHIQQCPRTLRREFQTSQETQGIVQCIISHHNFNILFYHTRISLLRTNQPKHDKRRRTKPFIPPKKMASDLSLLPSTRGGPPIVGRF